MSPDRRTPPPERRRTDDRRTTPVWFRLDAAVLADDKIIDLGEEHGPAGPLIYVALLGAAKLQDEAGRVHMGWRQLARGAFLADHAQAQAIVATCVAVGLLDEVHDEGRSFTAQIAGWDRRQIDRPAALSGAERTAKWRERKHPDSVTCDETPSHDRHTDVTDVTPGDDVTTTGTEDKDNSSPPLAGARASEAERSVAEVMQITTDARIGTPAGRIHPVDVFAVEQQVLRFPGLDYADAARAALARAAEQDRPPDFGRLFGWALQDQKDPKRPPSRGRPPRREDAERAARRARRGAALSAELGGLMADTTEGASP